MAMNIKKVAGALGAELSGLDLAAGLSADAAAEVRQALLDNGVIFLRRQPPTPVQFLAFGVSVVLVLRYLATGDGYGAATISILVKTGLLYALDRATGQFLYGKPFVEVNWMDGFDEKGRPVEVMGRIGGPKKR